MEEDPISATVDDAIRGCFGALLIFGFFVGCVTSVCLIAVSYIV
jgi:hypothetical protein